MKVTVQDAEIIKDIEPQQIREYLQSHGWHEDRLFLDNATIWHKQAAEAGEFEILLPSTKNLGDYLPRIREVIDIIAISENLSHLEVLGNFINNYPRLKIQGFVTQIATPHEDKFSGEITIIGRVFDKLRKIKTELIDHDYILAIKAYQERLPIVCMGDLVKKNDIFILKNLRDFQIENI
ncbi:hypothetical protein [Nostoc sp. TCL26-01]|uniref:hypothetical protein n=1 Tax=Nostoc sp. TCL26-01 TaxID=2576904 RepID=UPI0015BDF9A7|nr:hypothetical protein [Nostoc sp. TCL26-01]QLE56914.1 hypothetical protein FD725_16150 [Nostoc sp. TCL26-01]